MSYLESTQACVYAKFKSGYHVIRGGDRYLAGLDSVLTIEQPILRSLKPSGYWQGVAEWRRDILTLTFPVSVQYSLPCNLLSLVNTRPLSNTKLLFTDTGQTSIYCARNSTVLSHCQLPRNAQTTYVMERTHLYVYTSLHKYNFCSESESLTYRSKCANCTVT